MTDRVQMPLYSSPIPAPNFDSDESDETSQQSTDSGSYLSTQFHQFTRVSQSPKQLDLDDSLTNQDDSSFNESTPSNRKRKRSNECLKVQTPNQSPYTRRRNLDYVQQTTIQSPKIQRRTRPSNQFINPSPADFSTYVNSNPFHAKQHYQTRLAAKNESSIAPTLRNLFIQRYEQEFHQDLFLGYGEFSHVYLCTNRLDGLNYAVKVSKNSIIGTSYEQLAWREICAYAVLPSHDNLIRYYSAWIENDGRFFLQLEYCNGSSLEDVIEKNRQEKKYFHEDKLKNLLHQMSDVLTYMHSQDLAHLDIKPSNIMLCHHDENHVTYKLTDLGHVVQISSGQIEEDGDSRYLALEILQKSQTNQIFPDKCDVFSLGLTLYVCATNYNMPKEGNEWQQLRLNAKQYLRRIEHCTREFNELLLQRMCNVDPTKRPGAFELLLNPVVDPTMPTSREYLRHSLKQEREKNKILNKKLVDQYLSTSNSDLSVLPIFDSNNDAQSQQTIHSPIQSGIVPQQQSNIVTPSNQSRIVLYNTPGCLMNVHQSIPSPPISCGSLALKQQGKLAGSNMFRYHSSII